MATTCDPAPAVITDNYAITSDSTGHPTSASADVLITGIYRLSTLPPPPPHAHINLSKIPNYFD
ncbi:hypothetical protein J6590_032221 [Homalodisca vitripennis]|nr:hypothetical protein J6590_032221 [Homalodisca vitripennis]